MVRIAKDIAEADFLLLGGETSTLEAAKRMKEKHLGFALVGTLEGKPEGIITEWDFLSKIISEGKDPSLVKIREIMSKDLVSVKSNEGIGEIAKIMSSRGIRRVLVTQDGKIIGAITSKVILRRLEDYIDNVSAQIARLQTPMH